MISHKSTTTVLLLVLFFSCGMNGFPLELVCVWVCTCIIHSIVYSPVHQPGDSLWRTCPLHYIFETKAHIQIVCSGYVIASIKVIMQSTVVRQAGDRQAGRPTVRQRDKGYVWIIHTHIQWYLQYIHSTQASRGNFSLLIIIMKRLHMEHLPLRAQHDGRSVPAAPNTCTDTRTHPQAHAHMHGNTRSLSFCLPLLSLLLHSWKYLLDPRGSQRTFPSVRSHPPWVSQCLESPRLQSRPALVLILPK